MATLLAIETSGSSCSVALAINGEIIGLTDDTPRSHARKLLPMIDDLLASRGVKPKQLDGIAYSRGPGSFTGLRIGFGAVQGLAMGLDLPVWGVSTLLAMASKAANKYCLDSAVIIPVLDARMGEVYWGAYRTDKGVLTSFVTDSASTPLDVSESTLQQPTAVIGSGQPLLADAGISATQVNIADFEADGKVVASLALSAFGSGEFRSIDDAGLSYIRNEVSWKKHQKIRSSKDSSQVSQ